jgi:hypothetical protein
VPKKKKLETIKIYFNEMLPLVAAGKETLSKKNNNSGLVASLAVKPNITQKESKKLKVKSTLHIATLLALNFNKLKTTESKMIKLQKLPNSEPELDSLEQEMKILQDKVITLQDLNNTDSSSFIGNALYTPELQTVAFELNGKSYHYCSVSQRTWDSYVGSPSKGAAYNRLFKGQHTC